MSDLILSALVGLGAVFAGMVARHAPAGRPTFASLAVALGLASIHFALRLPPPGVTDLQENIVGVMVLPFLLYAAARYRVEAEATDLPPLDRQFVRFAVCVLGLGAILVAVASLLPPRLHDAVAAVFHELQGIIWVGTSLAVVGLLIRVRRPVEDAVLDVPACQATFLLVATVVALDERLFLSERPDQLADIVTIIAVMASFWLLFSSLGMSFRASAARRRRLEGEISRLYAETRRSEEYLRALTSCAPLAIIAADCSARITEMNEAAAQMCGLEADEKIGTRLMDCFAHDVRPQVKAVLKDVLAGGSVHNHDAAMVSETGQLVPVRISVSPLTDQAGQALGVVVVATDLRQQRRLEAQLVQSEKMAAIGELASGVAHEFNNALAVMTLAAQQALLSPSPEAVPRALHSIIGACQRSGETTRNLLSFAAPARPKVRPIDLVECADRALALMDAKLRESDIVVRREFAHDCPRALADLGQIQQVLLNLLLNARDAICRHGAITVAVRSGTCEWCMEHDGVEVAVTDTGTGIDPRDLPRVFDPFFTTKGPRGSGEGEGTGLGLSVALGIVEAHGGRITVESELDHGAGFTVCLPCAAVVGVLEEPAEPPALGGETPSDDNGARVLVVDDEDGVREVLAEFLESIGCEVSTAADADAARRAFNAGGFDIVFCDLVMPGASDGDIISDARAAAPEAAIVVITGKAEPGLEQEMARRGVDACLRKPFRLQRIAHLLGELTPHTHRP